MSDLQDALDWFDAYNASEDVRVVRVIDNSVFVTLAEAARRVANPDMAAAAEARYGIERKLVQNDWWPNWADLGDFGQRTHIEFIRPAVDAALGITE